MTVDKRLVDEVIRLTKKYFETGDTDYIQAFFEAKKVLEKSVSWQAVKLVSQLAQYAQTSGNGTYDDIYKALALFGIIVEEKENRK